MHAGLHDTAVVWDGQIPEHRSRRTEEATSGGEGGEDAKSQADLRNKQTYKNTPQLQTSAWAPSYSRCSGEITSGAAGIWGTQLSSQVC